MVDSIEDIDIDVTGTNNEKAPPGKDEQLRDRLKRFAEENNLVISEYVDKKLRFSETHMGVCFCDPLNRLKCPCDNVWDDIKRYNGRCLCRVLWKPDIYYKWKQQKAKTKSKDKQKKAKPIKKLSAEEKKSARKKIKDVWDTLNKAKTIPIKNKKE